MRRVPLLFALLLAVVPCVNAGEIVAFNPGKVQPAEALVGSTTKAVVAEFIGPSENLLGKEVSYIVWREILTAISDQRGAGVIIASAPPGERLTDLLQKDYHDAALQIAQAQRSRMALWGAVEDEAGKLSVDIYLTLLDDARGKELNLQWTIRGETLLSAAIKRTKFNFPVTELTLADLVKRPIVARGPLAVRSRAESGAPVMKTVPAGTLLQATGMAGGWFEVRMGAANGYVPIHGIDLPPPRALVASREVLRVRPESSAPTVALTTETTELRVADMRYISASGLWFRVEAPSGSGWIRAARTKPRYSLPAVHFVAGIYRYLVGRWDDAAREFGQYVASPGAEEDNASLATAYQLLGASRLLIPQPITYGRRPGSDAAMGAFSEAIRLAPYDPSGYSLRAVASAYDSGRLSGRAAIDLEQALSLDSNDKEARRMVEKGLEVGGRVALANRLPYTITDATAERLIRDLKGRYGIR